MSRRICLYGGSFNPPTLAHVAAVKAVAETMVGHGRSIDAVYVVPAYTHIHGKSLVSYEDRFEMCRRAFSGIENVHVSTLDRDIVSSPRGSMWSMCEQLLSMFPDTQISILIGQDQAEELQARWHRARDLLSMVHVLVLPRGLGSVVSEEKCPWLFHRGTLLDPLPAQLRDISSTEARQLLVARISTDDVLNMDVADYCSEKGLYCA